MIEGMNERIKQSSSITERLFTLAQNSPWGAVTSICALLTTIALLITFSLYFSKTTNSDDWREMSKMDLLDKLRMRLWLENRRLYGTGGINGDPVNRDFTPQDISKIQIDRDVAIPEHYKRVLVNNENERKAAFRKLLKDHGINIEGNRYNPDLNDLC